MRVGIALAAGTAALMVATLTGCGSSDSGDRPATSGQSVSATKTMAPEAPTGFDPCHDIPVSVLDSEGLGHQSSDANSDGSGGVKWRGCSYFEDDGYGVSIRTTNITLPMVRANTGFKVSEELNIGGRSALIYHDTDQPDQRAFCLLNAEMKGGSLEISIDNPATRRRSGTLASCDIAKELAAKLVPVMPANA
ncbi:DUF3558 domain-containing protein [Nocardia sp. BMG111209]|uniref:DUF3558 domain-containing protein n=1 Tax=Nocardia sp. BMG111209 TaxID=1160137 RepID=UPI0004758A0C|nr:DUF3558 domain-containing protein [Nocardia sp. BMG111209]